MAEDENAPEPTGQIPAADAPTPTTTTGPRLRDTIWNFCSMLAVAAASLVIGGAAGAAITALASDDDGIDRMRIANIDGRMMPGDGPQGPFGNDDEQRQWRQDGPRSGPTG